MDRSEVRRLKRYSPVAVSLFPEHKNIAANAACDRPHPRLSLCIRPDNQRLVWAPKSLGNRLCPRKVAAGSAKHFREVPGSVQMRIDGHHPVKSGGQQAADDVATQRLARREQGVLAHIAKVRCNQD